MKTTHVTIDLSALTANLAVVRRHVGSAKIWAMIKSDAYGHGLVQAAQALKAADAFGVASPAEAISLRDAGIKHPIAVMSRFNLEQDLASFVDYKLDLVLYHQEQLKVLAKSQLKSALTVWLKCDTGMHRLGLALDQVEPAWQRLQALAWVNKPVGLMTHLACADEVGHPDNQQQLDSFDQVTQTLSGPKSISNSAAILSSLYPADDWVRPGIMLYGISPFGDKQGSDFGLKPAMTLRSYLLSVYSLKSGEKIGYGHRYTCPQDMRIGIVAIGYGDGYLRHAVSGTPTLVNNKVCPLVGRVSMDLIAIDLSLAAEAKIGDEVILWGPQLPVEHIAKKTGTIAYELLTHIGRRIKCVSYLNE